MRSFVLTATAFVLVACAATSDPLCDRDVCTAADGGGITPTTQDECIGDPTNATCATDANALFVNLAAQAVGADGTQAHPFASIEVAMGRITEGRRRVYVCPGTYDGPHTVASGASLYGGLSCDWKKTSEKPTLVNNSGTAVTIKNAKFVVVSDVIVSSSAETATPGASATGVLISRSSDVTLQRVDITSGPGTKAAETPTTTPNYDGTNASQGGASSQPNGGAGGSAACKDMTSSQGGKGADNTTSNQTAGSANPPVGSDNKAPACAGGVGFDGLRPEKATPTIPIGSITEDGWTPATTRSTNGVNGRPGQGGGGAAASNPYGGSGGGSGGCGGTGGTGGAPGGSSFGVVLFQSTNVKITESAIKSGAGAIGGAGGAGQSGQKPGGGGTSGGTCKGERGGYGSGGAGGTGGHGGHSIAIAYLGEIPFVTGGARTTGEAGAGGPGGKGGADNGDPDHDPQNGGFDGDPGTPGLKEDISLLAN